MNDDNLIPLNKRTKSEQREITRKGGKASGRKRRDKRFFRDTISSLLELPMTSKSGDPIISPITGKPMSIRETIVTTAIQGAINGNVKHLHIILDILGERATIIKSELSGQVKTDSRVINYDLLTEEQRQTLVAIGEEVLSRMEQNHEQ